MRELTDLEKTILTLMDRHKGRDNRISRPEMVSALSAALNRAITDRNMRKVIETLRYDHPRGAYICSSIEGGYYKARTDAELSRYLEQEEKRAKIILARISRQRLRASNAKNTSLPIGGL